MHRPSSIGVTRSGAIFRLLNAYVARCQSVLQAGQPDNDLLLYWPIHDVWMQPEGTRISFTVHHAAWMEDQPVGKVAKLLMDQGYAFDFISDRLLQGARVSRRRDPATGGTYRAIVVPRCRTIPAATLGKLAELAEQGATVIFSSSSPEMFQAGDAWSSAASNSPPAGKAAQGRPDRRRRSCRRAAKVRNSPRDDGRRRA